MPDYPKSLFKNLGGNWTERLARNATEEKELLATGYASMGGTPAAPSNAAPTDEIEADGTRFMTKKEKDKK